MPGRAAVSILVLLVAIAGACSRSSPRPEITTAAAVDAGSPPKWPKSGRVSGTEEQLLKLVKIPGVTVDDHGQRRLGPGRWQVTVNVSDQQGIEGLRRIGLEPVLHDPFIADPGPR